MDKILKPIENGPTHEELVKMVYEVYESFRDVLETCPPGAKKSAVESMYGFQLLMNEYVAQVEGETQVDFKQVAEAILNSKEPQGELYREIKEKMISMKQELAPLIEKARIEAIKPRSKKARKRKMETRMKVKE
jgi:hypothetical protein